MHPMLNIAVRTVRKAGQLMVQGYEQPQPARPLITTVEEVLPIERTIAQAMIVGIQRSYPQHTITSATGEQSVGSNPDVQWVIEPLAGRVNFSQRLPHCAQAIMISIRAVPELLVIYDALRNEIFTAIRGSGVQLNGYRLRIPSTGQSLTSKVFASQLEPEKSISTVTLAQVNALLRQGALIRCSGCSLLDLAYVAAGRLDGFWANQLPDWIVKAGTLLVAEAGGLVTDGSGSPQLAGSQQVVAASAKLLKLLLQQLRASNS